MLCLTWLYLMLVDDTIWQWILFHPDPFHPQPRSIMHHVWWILYCIVLYLNDMIIKSSSSLILNWMWALAWRGPFLAQLAMSLCAPATNPYLLLVLHFVFSNSIRIVQCASMPPRLDFGIIFQIQYLCQFQFDPSIQFDSLLFWFSIFHFSPFIQLIQTRWFYLFLVL